MFQKLRIMAVVAAVIFSFTSALAFNEPAVNLGLTSFVDGGPPAGPGVYFQQYFMYYTTDQFNDSNGDDASPPGLDLDVWLSMTQLLYQSDKELVLGGKWGLNFMVPVVSLDVQSDLPPGALEDNGTGLGDIVVGPFLQWDPVMGEKGPIFMHRFEFSVVFPTGKFDEDKALNPGSKVYSINPYWAATLFMTPKWTATTRLHYLWNSKNPDTDVQPGTAFHANFATSYDVIERTFRLGINGYYLKQLTDTEVDGNAIDDKEQVLGIGPGALISFGPNHHLFLNAYWETSAENRPEGQRFYARYVHHF